MMQSHLHQLQQQLSSLLSAALPQSPNDAVSSQSSLEVAASGRGIDDSARIAALDSLRRAVLYPPNALLLPHCAHFLSQGFSQLLSDKSYGVRQAAAMSYASLSAVLASATVSSNGLPNHVLVHVHVLVDKFLAWALPLLRGLPVRNGSAELALTSLREFLSAGDAVSAERYVPSILNACQELLEDERTSLSLLHQLLSILTLISLKFAHCFQPHFIDVVDLLLGWAFMPDLSDSARCLLTDSFLQFRNHWLSNLQFSLGLLSKLLGDAEVLIYDVSVETSSQLGRLLSFFSCFSTILQATANGILEMNLLGQVSESLENLTPQLLRCISMLGRKFGWSKWMGGSWRCLILLAEILNEKFSQFYPMVVDIFFHRLSGVPSYQVLEFLKTNLQLLSLQKLGLLSSSVQILLQFHSPLSHLRLHPNHSVVASTSATYLYFLQHGSDDIVSQAITSLFEELELLKRKLAEMHLPAADSGVVQLGIGTDGVRKANLGHERQYSKLDFLSLIKFDLMVIICSMSVDAVGGFANQTVIDSTINKRSSRVTSFILNKFDPFQFPIDGLYELQAHVIRTLHKSSEVEFLVKFNDAAKSSINLSDQDQPSFAAGNKLNILISEYLGKFSEIVVRALNVYSPLTVKMEVLGWIHAFSRMILTTKEDDQLIKSFNEPYQDATIGTDLLFCILDAAFARELKVRSHIGPVLELLLQTGLIHPENFFIVLEVVLHKLSDPDVTIKNAFVRLLSIAVPVFIYMHGIIDEGYFCQFKPKFKSYRFYLNWRQTLALKQMPQKFHSQQLVSVLSYISQRWKVPLSSWIHRLVLSCRGRNGGISNQEELIGDLASSDLYKDAKAEELILQKICPVNSLAAIWWAINEAARYCINLRLRTNLGGPTQTFAALEHMLLDIPNILQLDFDQSEGHYLGSSNFHLLPMRLLLAFVEALKKNAYSAYEGSAVLPQATRQSSLFFRANKKVCEEWFSRIYEPMFNAGLALNCQDATSYYCTLRLQDLKNLAASTFEDKTQGMPENFQNLRGRFAGDILKVLQYASLALCKSHEPEALIGLQKWVGMTFPSLLTDDNHLSSSVNGNHMHLSWMTGLVYQAQGKYEMAAAHFSHLLQSEDALSSMGSDGIQFIIARVIENYTSLSDWKSLENWLSELHALRSMHAGKPYSGALTAAGNEMNAIHALARFDEGDLQAALGYLDLTPKSSCQLTLNPNVALERSEQMLLRSMLQMEGGNNKVHEDLDKAKVMLDEALSCIPLDGLTEATAFAVQLHCVVALEENRVLDGHQLPSILGSLCRSLHSPISRINQDCSLWMKIFRIYRTIMPASYVTMLLGQRMLSLARKQSNFMLADRMNKYLNERSLSEHKHAEFLTINLQYEGILLKYAVGKPEEALLDLWSFIHTDFLSSTTFGFTNISKTKARACLKLSSWMRPENSNLDLRSVISKIHEDLTLSRADGTSICSKEVLLSANSDHTCDTKWNTVLEEIIGTTIKLSCKLYPKMGKAWLSYAAWCFIQARNSLSVHVPARQPCSSSSILDEEISPVRFQLSKDEKSKVKSIITDIYSRSHMTIKRDQGSRHFGSTSYPEDQAFLDSLAHETTYLMEAAAGAPGFESIDGECPSVVLFSELKALFFRSFAGIENSDSTSYVQQLIDIWCSLRRRRVSLFGHAAHGYFQFLSHSSFGLKESNCTNIHPDYAIGKSRSYTLRAMLYILVILLNYGVELEETLNHGFATVPPLPWQEITPQLFARLSSHPQQVVRKQIEGLLMILAKVSPWSIVYPLLVDINGFEGQSSEELQNIHAYLFNMYPKLIQDVKLVINELGSITILWEEQWLSTLQDLHTDVVRRINMLKEETARIAKNSSLSHAEKNKINAAKYSAMMAPIVVALDRRLASTSREPETVHEQWFQNEYGKQLKSAILTFKTPPSSASALGDAWRAFDAIAAALAVHQRKSFFYLSELAPKLALLASSDVPMPGFEREISLLDDCGSTAAVQGIVTISSFSEQVEILSTKTRPKKLVLLGSDGQKYTYLLKGREDLRLDARIMQLLQAINCFLTSSSESNGKPLGIRCYSVTPINGQAGLIQWVDNVTSIYNVYKSWQNRNQLAHFSATGAINLSNPIPPVPRPSDMFYGKIIPALKEKGIRRVISRRDWPHEVKRKVLLDLMQETPRLLLWQEMWCGSEGFKAFHSKTRRFSGTVAVMSIVGHVLGLGDRHLDNILMDFITGEVVHIDYNVCFDKGRRLKIPEIVPFRLTQTIEAALGLTGFEGFFRANCETVINMLRKNKDIVLMLLEVFVWDPLVEWTREDKHDEAVIGGEEKKGMELAVSLSLFASRFQEIRVPLLEHHDLLVSTLPAAESALKRFLDLLIQYEIVSVVFYHADKERSSLLQHETTAKSFAAETTTILEKSRAYFEAQAHEFAQAKLLATEKALEAAAWVEEHGKVLDALRSGSFPDSQTCINLRGLEEALSLTAAVLVSGVPLTVVPEPTQAQCYDLDREISSIIAELDDGLSCGIEALHEYAFALQSVLPFNYVTTSPVNSWAQVLQLSVNNISAEVLSFAVRQAADIMAKAQGIGLDSIHKRHQDLLGSLERYAMEIETLDKECSEMMNSIGSDAEAKSKERLLSAFLKHLQSAWYTIREDNFTLNHLGKQKLDRDLRALGDLDVKKEKALCILHMAINELYADVKENLISMSKVSSRKISWKTDDSREDDFDIVSHGVEEQIEKCVLLAGFVDEAQEFIGMNLAGFCADNVRLTSEHNWASTFQAILHSIKHLSEKITGSVLSEIIQSFISSNAEVMDAFGSLSHVRGSIDTALEKLVEVELDRASLLELEKNYFMKVGLITEQQLSLEEAAADGRDHLSWEETEELATQGEACRAQLDLLHQAWNEKDARVTALARMETNIGNSLTSLEGYFLSLISIEDGELHTEGNKLLLSALVKPFAELESLDHMLSSYASSGSYSCGSADTLSNLLSGFPFIDSIWKLSYILKNHLFFIWKIGVLDSILDSCMHEISSYVDHNIRLDQLCNVLKNKVGVHLQKHFGQYLNERVVPAFLAQLERENENLHQKTEQIKNLISEDAKDYSEAVRRVRLMLEEYCNAHETARAANAAICTMKRHIDQLTEAFHKTTWEITQLEWLHEQTLPQLLKTKVFLLNTYNDNMLLKTSRGKLLEKMQSSISSMARSLECLKVLEKTSISVEGQLERAMVWACAGSNTVGTGSSSTKSSGIPSEFHDHLSRRRKLLWTAHEHASDVLKICTYVIEFEVSRDGIFLIHREKISGQTTGDSRTWQQTYLTALTRLDSVYLSFARAEKEWKLSQNKTEAAANGLLSATNELCIASIKAKSASADLQDNLLALRICLFDASLVLSSFISVSEGHTALTSEVGSMLEEVLVVTEDLHDVYSLAKKASAAHSALTADLAKANMILLPLGASLSSDVATMNDAILKEKESSVDVLSIHGQALYQSYFFRLQEACQLLASLVPSITYSVKELYSMLTKLSRDASTHAGNLHKALEGLGESEVVKSQELVIPRPDFSDGMYANDKLFFVTDDDFLLEDNFSIQELTSDDQGWISPPDCSYTSSKGFSITSNDAEENSYDLEKTWYAVNSGESINSRKERVSDEKSESGNINIDVNASGSAPRIKSVVGSACHASNMGEETSDGIRPQGSRDEQYLLSPVKGREENQEDLICSNPLGWGKRGKNAYALSVLRQVELKIEGRDIDDGRAMPASQQVDHLIREATSIDNLCNMYEGWTPWI